MATEHLIITRKTTGEHRYKVTAERDLTSYPKTSAGDLAFLAAVRNGGLNLTTEDGCPIPAGVKPPINEPDCSSTGADGPSWLSARYSDDGTVLSILAKGDDCELKFERIDGQAFSLSNPDGVTVNSGTFYGHGTASGDYVMRWQVIGLHNTAIRITFRRKSDGALFPYSFTTVTSVTNNQLFTAVGGGTPTDPTDPTDPSGFTYPVPTAQSDWQHFSDVREGSAPSPGGVGIARKYYDVLESDDLLFEVASGYGCTWQFVDKRINPSKRLINRQDLGRECGLSDYGKRYSGESTPYWQTGYNPLQAGDSGGNPATLLFHGYVDGWLYTETQQNDWEWTDNRKVQMFNQQWVKMFGNKVNIKIKKRHANPDKTLYESRPQEWPFMMINGTKNVIFSIANNPWGPGSVITTNSVERIDTDGSGNPVYVSHSGNFNMTSNFIGVELGDYNGQKRYAVLIDQRSLYAHYDVFHYGESDDEFGTTITYVGFQPQMVLDPDGVWYFDYWLMVGSLSEIQAFAQSLYTKLKPDFTFGGANARSDWYMIDGIEDDHMPFPTNAWRTNWIGKTDNPSLPFSARGSKMISPVGYWPASQTPKLYIKYKVNQSPESKLRLQWTLNGQEASGIDSSRPNQAALRTPKGYRDYNQKIDFDLIKDGQYHTVELNVSANSLWKDIVQQLEITCVDGGQLDSGAQKIDFKYIGANNPN